MTLHERLARAVLLFHQGSRWGADERAQWLILTGSEDATTRVLCDLARAVCEAAEPAPA